MPVWCLHVHSTSTQCSQGGAQQLEQRFLLSHYHMIPIRPETHRGLCRDVYGNPRMQQ